MQTINPNQKPVVTEDRTQALRVLRKGGADALLLDLPVALGLARENPAQLHVLGQLSGGEGLAAALPKGSPNSEIVDSNFRALTANGTISKLESRWLGKSAGDVPLILTQR
jgi:ABC-type amino acid transport substrate-binding protein